MNEIKLFDFVLIDFPHFLTLVLKVILNLGSITILVRYLYRSEKKKEYHFTYFLIGLSVFFLCYLLENVKLQLGLALGLFAIFGIIRYRTTTMPIKEMTYLFMIIGISVINSLSNERVSIAELVFTNLTLIGATYWLEKRLFHRDELRKTIVYDNLANIRPENQFKLVRDIEDRTGIEIERLEIGKIDFSKKNVTITIFYTRIKRTVSIIENEQESPNI